MRPSVVVLAVPGRWVVGSLVSKVWSVAGDSDRDAVNNFLAQYFINSNDPHPCPSGATERSGFILEYRGMPPIDSTGDRHSSY